MNVHTGRQPTPAESALVDGFVDRMGELPGDGEIASARDNAIEALKTQGLPSRRVEPGTTLICAHCYAAFPPMTGQLEPTPCRRLSQDLQSRPFPTASR